MLPFDVLGVIAQVSIGVYRALLALPRFARASLAHNHQYRYRCCYLIHHTEDNINTILHRWYIPFPRNHNYIKLYHRHDGPADYAQYRSGKLLYERWVHFGLTHRNVSSDGQFHPAYTRWDENGQIQYEQWFSYNKLHRLDGPASINYDENGKIRKKKWYINGQRHCINGPASISYYANGKICIRKWFINGQLHRIDGPAVSRNADDGADRYYLYGNEIDKTQYIFAVDCMHRIM
jgi:hypothetical protein